MRVAVFTNQFPALVSTFFSRDMLGLIHAGLDIDVFPIRPHHAEFWQYVPASLSDRLLPKNKVHYVLARRGLPVTTSSMRRLPMMLKEVAPISVSAVRYGIGPIAKTAYAFLKASAAALEYQRHRYDHVLTYWGSYPATYAYLFQRFTNRQIPFSMFLHACDLYQDPVYLRQKLLYADNVFVVCDFNREFIRTRYNRIFDHVSQKIHLYHPSLDLDDLSYEPNGERSRRILAVGRLDRCKGFDYLIRAVDWLARAGVDVHADIIGDGDEMRSLAVLAGELGVQHRIRFQGWLPFDKVKAAMRTSRALIHPSSELGDAVPTVIKEALALGTPVIATSVAGIPQLLDGGRCGILVPPRDVVGLAGAIGTLLTDDAACRNYAARGRAYAEEHFDHLRNGRRLAAQLRSTPCYMAR